MVGTFLEVRQRFCDISKGGASHSHGRWREASFSRIEDHGTRLRARPNDVPAQPFQICEQIELARRQLSLEAIYGSMQERQVKLTADVA